MQRATFPAMGTEVEVLLDAAQSAGSSLTLQRVQDEFERLEALLSRFRPDSELSALNRSGHARGGPELVEVTLLALEARERTRGRFDPTVHDALVSAGYDRTFDELAGSVVEAAPPAPCLGNVTVDAASGLIELAPEPGSISAASPRVTPPTVRAPCSRSPGLASSTPAATSLPAAGPGPSGSRLPKAHSPSSSRTARSPRPVATAGAGRPREARRTT
jgi:hypothetical protein